MNGKTKPQVRTVVAHAVNGPGRRLLFKPGYPTGRNQYMCLDRDRKEMLRRAGEAGLVARPLPGVGPDRNYGGMLYAVEFKQGETAGNRF